jgi:outer membrane protein assembly factor BamB
VLDATTGALQWSMPIQSSQSPNAGFVDQVLYVTSDDRQVHAIDVTRRAELWSVPVTGTPSAPAVLDGAIFVNTSSGEVIRIVSVLVRP